MKKQKKVRTRICLPRICFMERDFRSGADQKFLQHKINSEQRRRQRMQFEI